MPPCRDPFEQKNAQEAKFCCVAEGHQQVMAYAKNHALGLEVPYRYGAEMRRYRPDFVLQIDDGGADPL